MNRKAEAYAVIRYDRWSEAHTTDLTHLIKVVAVLPTLDEAKSEVARLSEINSEKGTEYLWQYAPYYPDGRGVREANAE